MSPDHDLRRPRGPRRALRAAALAGALSATFLGAVALPSIAAADEGTTVVGELVHVVTEVESAAHTAEEPGADGTRISWVETDAGAVRVPAEQVATVPAGATVELTVGGTVEDEAGDDGYDDARTVLEGDVLAPPPAPQRAPAPRGGVTNRVTVALVAPAGTMPDGTLLRDVVDTVDGPVADFWAEQTGGAITVGVTGASDWVRTSAGCGDPEALWSEVAAAVGFAPGPGEHLLLRLSGETATQPACSYALAEMGAVPASGGRMYVRDTLASIIAHELGHNFGLGHSSAEQCDGTVESGSCRIAGYRDFYDVMGASWAQLGSLNAAQASALQVLPADAERTVFVGDGATSVPLAPLAGTGGIRALRLVDAEGVAYWLELRSGSGRDGWLAGRDNVYRLDSGVLLRRAGRFPDTALLLDGTPGAAAGWETDLQSALPIGVAVSLSGGDFTVTVESVDPAGAVVRVVPAAPATGAEVQAPRESAPRPEMVSGAPAAAPEVEVVAPQAPVMRAPAAVEISVPRRPVALEPVADSSPSLSGMLPPVAGTVLAGASLLLLKRSRRGRLQR